jgi:hypothetical protein
MQLFISQVESIPCLDALLGINRETGWNLGIVNFKRSGLDHFQCLVYGSI